MLSVSTQSHCLLFHRLSFVGVVPSHIRIELIYLILQSFSMRQLSLGYVHVYIYVCTDVRVCTEDATYVRIEEVVRCLNYTDRAEHSLGFQCPHPLHSHAAEVYKHQGRPINLRCCVAKMGFELPPGYEALLIIRSINSVVKI